MRKGIEITATDSMGRKVEPVLVIGDFAGYTAGTILDANAIIKLIATMINGGTTIPNAIGSELIIDGSILTQDLSTEVIDKINSNYDSEDETLYTNSIISV